MTIVNKVGQRANADTIANLKAEISRLQGQAKECTKAAGSAKDPEIIRSIESIKKSVEKRLGEMTSALKHATVGKTAATDAGLLNSFAIVSDANSAIKVAAANATPTALPTPSVEQIKAAGGGVEGYIKAARTLKREAEVQES